MIRAAKLVVPIVVGATALAMMSLKEASAGVPYINAPLYSQEAEPPGLVQHVWWRGGWGWWVPASRQACSPGPR